MAGDASGNYLMHDLPDAYSKAIAAAVAKANVARRAATAVHAERQDEISAELEIDIAAAGVALEAGLSTRIAAFRGDHNRESEVMPSVPEPSRKHEIAPGGEAPPSHAAGGAAALCDYEIEVLRHYATGESNENIVSGAALNAVTEELRERGLIDRKCCVTQKGEALLDSLQNHAAEKAAREEEDRRFLAGETMADP